MMKDNNLETFSVVCLDVLIDDSVKSINIKQRLRTLGNRLEIFQCARDCEEYIRSVPKKDQIVLIISADSSRKLLPHIYQLPQIFSIFIYDKEQTHDKEFFSKLAKVKDVTGDLEALLYQFASDQERRDFVQAHETLPLTVFNINNAQDRSTTGLNGQFVHSQLLLDCLLRMKSFSSDKNELIARIQKDYEGNIRNLAILQEFQETYSSDRAVWWYTRALLFYRILNKALRLQDIELLFLFRFFIRDIQLQLERHQCSSSIRIYRGQLISERRIEMLQRSVGQFISINSFMSTSVKQEVALIYIIDITPTIDIQPVLFQIDADPQFAGNKPFANITSLSNFPSEEEVLFMPGSIYRLIDVVYGDGFWTIQMTLCTNNDHELHSIFDYMKNQYGSGERNLLSFGAVLYDMGKYIEAEKCYQRVLSDTTCDDHAISTCYHAMGCLALERGDYDSSLEWNHKLLQICAQKQELDKTSLAHCYNSIGVAYQKKGDLKHALHSYNTALMMWKYILGENHPKIATCLNNLGGVYHSMEQYSKSLDCHHQALAIWEIVLPANCSELGAAHNNIGCVYGCLNRFDKAMEHYNLALKIYEKSLPPNHAANAKTLENIGLVHYLRNELEEALVFYQKASAIYHQALPSTHPKLVKIEKDIQNVLARKMPSSFHFWWLDNLKVSHNDTIIN